jgi:A/G-specific adenine glycosylase
MNDSSHNQRLFVRKVLRWGRTHRRAFPWRKEGEPFRLLIAEVLLQRSRASTVACVYEKLFEQWPTPEALANAPVAAIEDVIRPLGLLGRAPRLRSLARAICDEGRVPTSLEAIAALPGVGRYAASATIAVTQGRRVPTVDGTSARVYRRYFALAADKDSRVDDELWALVAGVLPSRKVSEWNWAVLDLAASTCLPKVPKCGECPLSATCSRAFSSVRTTVGATS